MRILVWTDGFWPRIGGTETQVFQFVQECQNRGHSCIVIAQRDHLGMKEEEIYEGMLIRRFDFNSIIKSRELKLLHFVREYLDRVLSEFQPDTVYLNTLGNGSAFAFLLFRKLFKMLTVATVHAPYYGEALPPLVEQICLLIDHVCCASKWGYREMSRLLPTMRHKLKMIPYGLSLPVTTPSQLVFPVILFLGRLSSEKGFEIGLEAFALLRSRGINAHLIIAGEGDERPFLEAFAQKFGIQDDVEFTGGIPRDKEAVFYLINRAAFVVMPSHFEAFGLVALESMRMGRPVIASDVGGLPEIISNKETGLLVPPGNISLFASAMQDLLEHPQDTIEMGARAREWAIRNYLLEDNVQQYESLFHESFNQYCSTRL
jgi:glycosyltransferase involved in cell wall biosynthesis